MGRWHLGLSLGLVISCMSILPKSSDAEPVENKTDSPSMGLIGYWKLAADCRDYSGHNNHGINRGVVFAPRSEAGPAAAKFNGRGNYIEVPPNDSLSMGTRAFSVAVWVKCEAGVRDVPGDIISKYDPPTRTGINFHITAGSPAYCSVSDARNVHFGIDNAQTGPWVDHGRVWPGNTLVSTLIVHQGELYAGIADAPNPKDACRVFRHASRQEWVDCGRVGNDLECLSVMSMVVHRGRLYAGTGTWDWEKVFEGKTGPARVYRYEGGTTWHDCGSLDGGHRALSLASFDGRLFVSDDQNNVFRYDGDDQWNKVRQSDPKLNRIDSLMVYRGHLFGARARVWRYDGADHWAAVGDFRGRYNISQIHSMTVYAGSLYLGGWPEGRILRYDGSGNWTDCGSVGVVSKPEVNEINDFVVYNGNLYAGVIPKAELWRYDGGREWTRIKQLVTNSQWSPKMEDIATWNRVPCLTVFQGRLFAGTSTCHGRADATDTTDAGKVFSWEVGKCVSYDHDLGVGWRHLVAVRQADRLELYIDAKLVSTSSPLDHLGYDLTNNKPLLIGFGAEDYFTGSMRELRIYNRALTTAQIETIHGLAS